MKKRTMFATMLIATMTISTAMLAGCSTDATDESNDAETSEYDEESAEETEAVEETNGNGGPEEGSEDYSVVYGRYTAKDTSGMELLKAARLPEWYVEEIGDMELQAVVSSARGLVNNESKHGILDHFPGYGRTQITLDDVYPDCKYQNGSETYGITFYIGYDFTGVESLDGIRVIELYQWEQIWNILIL